MKTITWIQSVQLHDGGPPIGYRPNAFSSQIKKLQSQIKAAFAPEFSISFVSFDISSQKRPDTDLIIYNELDARYLNEEIKAAGLLIPFQSMITLDTENIEQHIRSFL